MRCGTPVGPADHFRLGVPMCEACRRVKADALAQYRKDRYLNGGPLLIDATGMRRRIEALMCLGWSYELVGNRAGVTGGAVRRWRRTASMERATVRKITRVYDELCMTPGPSKGAAAMAKRMGYAPPLAWDDIDDPDERPSTPLEQQRAQWRRKKRVA